MSRVDEETLSSLKDLKKAVRSEEFESAVAVCESLLQNPTISGDEALVSCVYEAYTKSLLHLEKYEKILSEIEKASPVVRAQLHAVHVYALYRLQRYAQARDKCKDVTDVDISLVYAQSLYHLSETAAAVEVYRQLLEECEDDAERKMQIYTNMVGIVAANATPYVRSETVNNLLKTEEIQSFVETSKEYPYDLVNNWATWELVTDGSRTQRWKDMLLKAQNACQEACEADGLTDAETQKELASIAVNQQWIRQLWNGIVAPHSIPSELASVQLVQDLNRVLAMPNPADAIKKFRKDSLSSMTALQQRLINYNRAALALQANELELCRSACDSLAMSVTAVSKSKKKRQQTSNDDSHVLYQPTVSEEEAAWWTSRVCVLRAHAAKLEGKIDSAGKEMDIAIQLLEQIPTSTVRDHALCYVTLHKEALHGAPQDAKQTIALLNSLPDSIRSSRAVIATLASIYQRQGFPKEAESLLRETGDNQIFADFAMAEGNYTKAAELYEATVKDSHDPIATARWVQALSHIDPERALKLWSETKVNIEHDNEVAANGPELEEQELPRLKKKINTSDFLEAPVNDKQRRSRESVLRQRGKRREQYLEELEKKGLYRRDPPTKPDPERWLPKYERSYARRRRNRGGAHKGAQGGVSEKDAAKLDVVARQAARAAGQVDVSGPSTAHIKVSSGKSGRRR
jgi:signal recognition particle subunit SRP72